MNVIIEGAVVYAALLKKLLWDFQYRVMNLVGWFDDDTDEILGNFVIGGTKYNIFIDEDVAVITNVDNDDQYLFQTNERGDEDVFINSTPSSSREGVEFLRTLINVPWN